MKKFRLSSAVLASTIFLTPLILFESASVNAFTVSTCNAGAWPDAANGGPPPLMTSKYSTIQILTTGCVRSVATDAIDMDAAGTVIVDSGNTVGDVTVANYHDAIHATTGGFFAINVTAGPSTITIGNGASPNKSAVVNDTGVAISANATVTINNAGGIVSLTSNVIEINAAAANSTINNTGSINLAGGPVGIVVTAPNFTLNNNFVSANQPGVILGRNGKDAVQLNTGATNAIVTNTGSIGVEAAGNDGIFINETGATINNNAPGNIYGHASAIEISIGGTAAVINNSGTLSSLNDLAQSQATVLVAATGLQLTNSGTINANNSQNAIQLNTTAPNAKIINTGNINTTNAASFGKNAISIDAANATVTNTSPGVIDGRVSAINITANGTSATINNTGTIEGKTGQTAPTINNLGAGLTINNGPNSGLIQAISQKAIFLGENDGALTTTVNNQTGATISATGGVGGTVGIFLGGVAGQKVNVNNTGTITSDFIAIDINGEFNGAINNNSGGVISGTSSGIAIDILGNAPNSSIINNANGLITSVNNLTIDLNAGIKTIINAGTISTTNSANVNPVIRADVNGVTISNGIVNSGLISSARAATQGNNITQLAIDLQNGKTGVIADIINTGTIIGNVNTASGGGTVLDMLGGTIQGTVFTSPGATPTLTTSSTLNLEAGVITNNPVSIQLGGSINGDIVNIDGTIMNGIDTTNTVGAGNNTFNITGGSFISLHGNPTLKNDTINVNDDFTFVANTTAVVDPAGNFISNIGTLNVNNAGTVFTVSTFNNSATNAIQGLKSLVIDPGTTMNVNANIGLPPVTGTAIVIDGTLNINNGPTNPSWVFDAGIGTTVNNGVLRIGTTAQLIDGQYIQGNTNPAAIYAPGVLGPNGALTNPGIAAKILVGGAGAVLDGTINPFLGGPPVFIPEGTFFDILTTDGALVDNTTLVQPNSAVIFFEKQDIIGDPAICGPNNNCIILIAHRRTFASLAECPNVQGVAGILDVFAQGTGPTDPMLLALLTQLQFATEDEIEEVVESLAPQVNGALSNAAAKSFDFAFASIQRRLEDVRGLSEWGSADIVVTRDGPYGYSWGDRDIESPMSTWIYGAGTYFDQRGITCASGFRGDAATLAIGTDWAIVEGGSRIGFVLNRTNTHSINKNDSTSILNSESTQGTFYAWFDPMQSVYADVAIGFALHDFENRRNIGFDGVGASAFSNFGAIQYGAQVDLGYAFNYDTAIFAPVVRARYTHLDADAFSEDGAGSFNLTTDYLAMHEFLLGVGFRAAMVKGNAQVSYAPELSLMYMRELANNLERAESNFIGASVAFPTVQIRHERNRFLVGLGLNTHSSDKYVFSVKYELEIRDHFVGNTGSLQLVHYWN